MGVRGSGVQQIYEEGRGGTGVFVETCSVGEDSDRYTVRYMKGKEGGGRLCSGRDGGREQAGSRIHVLRGREGVGVNWEL